LLFAQTLLDFLDDLTVFFDLVSIRKVLSTGFGDFGWMPTGILLIPPPSQGTLSTASPALDRLHISCHSEICFSFAMA